MNPGHITVSVFFFFFGNRDEDEADDEFFLVSRVGLPCISSLLFNFLCKDEPEERDSADCTLLFAISSICGHVKEIYGIVFSTSLFHCFKVYLSLMSN